jgi:hypothetical protein
VIARQRENTYFTSALNPSSNAASRRMATPPIAHIIPPWPVIMIVLLSRPVVSKAVLQPRIENAWLEGSVPISGRDRLRLSDL